MLLSADDVQDCLSIQRTALRALLSAGNCRTAFPYSTIRVVCDFIC